MYNDYFKNFLCNPNAHFLIFTNTQLNYTVKDVVISLKYLNLYMLLKGFQYLQNIVPGYADI